MENPTQGPAPLMNGELAGGSKEAEHATVYASHAEEVGQQEMPQNTDLSMMPQQVYVTSGMPNHPEMVGIEEQFRSMGMVSSDHHRNLDTEGLEDEYDLEGDNDEETSDEEPLKLFVGQVPKMLNEEDIFPIFEPFGPLKELAVIRDKHTGLHRGCAFVTYWSYADGENAQATLHDQFTFPGGRRPAQVKPAEPSGAVQENKLFVGMLSRKADEDEVQELFSPFGEIQEIYMIRNADGSSKCAAFLRYVDRESAVRAIETLNHSVVMEGATRPLIVKFADNKQQRQARQIRNSRRDQMLAVMRSGAPFPGFPMPVPGPMGIPPQYRIPGYPPHPPPPTNPTVYGASNTPHPHPHHPLHPHAYMYPPHLMGAIHPYAYPTQQEMRGPNPRPREGPAGANLFVYHLPHDLTDADLATAFNPFGNVISAKVYVDRNTGESKGFGFVSYDSVMAAEAAIEQMNGFQIGNKRLKVQHKRVNSSMPPSPSGPVPMPGPPYP
ncbi:RNA recognition motif containing protein [Fragilaria crotonensis]|nr:RNA recognition motif containing protein [Fragilaria crotonensis]